MFKLLLVVLAILLGIVFYNSLPDIQRYLRIRSM
jgi:hypothetical protein